MPYQFCVPYKSRRYGWQVRMFNDFDRAKKYADDWVDKKGNFVGLHIYRLREIGEY